MNWIGRGCLRVGKKFYGYGEEVPLDLIPNEKVEELTKSGELGVVPEVYDPSKHLEGRIKELEAANRKLKKEVKELKPAAKESKSK